MLKTLIVYAHLLAACVAIGILLIQDLALAKSKGARLSETAIRELTKSADIMFMALVVLWISGLALVLVGYIDNPQQYLFNEKLWAKFTVVSVLTLNGIALHYFSFPRMISSRGLLGQPAIEQILMALTGAISTVSWLFACYLGIARNWNYTVDYSFVMFIYSGLLICAFIVAGEVLRGMRKGYSDPRVLNERIPMGASRKFD
ncbi:hypothetical protein [Cellvibrio mixtus]|uniref:hypothetical protein n=1 Tax=Cellvibrio mixtus TaxID=39650 RepID=UPI00058746F2|nr:hypothetical protein [Cellvibrio mixtus]